MRLRRMRDAGEPATAQGRFLEESETLDKAYFSRWHSRRIPRLRALNKLSPATGMHESSPVHELTSGQLGNDFADHALTRPPNLTE